MASCEDDFSLIDDDNHNQTNPNHHHIFHSPYLPHRFPPKSPSLQQPPPPSPSQTPLLSPPADDDEGDHDDETESVFANTNPYTDSSNQYNSDAIGAEKRTTSEGNEDKKQSQYGYKRARVSCNGVNTNGEYRKDREEWSDVAIGVLLDAYVEKLTELNRGNLRGRDWEEVAAIVSERCEKQRKTVEQCKNKVDNLKKRYKLERHRMSSGGVATSHWPWFGKMEEIVGHTGPVKAASAAEECGSGGSSIAVAKQPKRCATPTAVPVAQAISVHPKSIANTKWRRVVFKISGIALAGNGPNNTDPKVFSLIAREVAKACKLGVQVAIVVGGRNFFCGETWMNATGSDRRTAYQIGMMASVMNSIMLQSALEKVGIEARIQSALAMQEVAEPYCRRRAVRHLDKGRVVIFGGLGTGGGNPLFSTDTSAAFQASEIHADAVLKGTNVDGVYDCHSQDNSVIFEHVSFRDLASRGATLMDMMALSCCEGNNIPVVVFNLLEPGSISKALSGERVGTLIDQTGRTS